MNQQDNFQAFDFIINSQRKRIQMEPVKSIVRKGLPWRLCHSFNKFLAGGFFLTASIFLYPDFQDVIDTDLISGWLFMIGSFVWMIADIMQWQHYAKMSCRHFGFALNFMLNCLSTFFYLLASDYLIPSDGTFDKENHRMGMNLFTTASVFLIFSQIWKLMKIINENNKSIKEVWREESTRIKIEVCLTLGGFSYMWGSILFKDALNLPSQRYLSALLLTLGGIFYFTSGSFIHKLYFWQKPERQRVNAEDRRISLDSIDER